MVNVYGSGLTFIGGSGDGVNFSGTSISASFGNGSYVGLYSGDQGVNLTLNNSVVGAQTGVGLTLAGAANIFSGSSGDFITDDGNANVFNGANYDVDLGISNLTGTVNAYGLTFSEGAGVTGSVITLADNIGGTDFEGGGFVANAGANDLVDFDAQSGMDIVNWGPGLGSDSVTFNPSSSISALYTEWTGPGLTGTEGGILTDFTVGGSQLEQFNPQSGTTETFANYSGANESGNLTSVVSDYINGFSSIYSYIYDSAGNLLEMTGDIYASSGALTAGVDYDSGGQELDGFGQFPTSLTMLNVLQLYGFSGNYRFFGLNSIKPDKNSGVTGVAAYESKLRDPTAAISSEIGQLQAQAAAATPTAAGLASAVFAPFVWSRKTITWTMNEATGAGTPFTGALGSQYESAVQQAFQTWAQASGLKFVEVGGGNADIKVGLAQFDSQDTGIQGLSQVRAPGGQAASADIMLEDPAEDALAADANGRLAYAGTQTEFGQLMLHEIGHVLGLADSSDPGSVMAAVLNNANETLDATDLHGIQALYGASAAGTPSVATMNYWNRLRAESSAMVQAMAGFTHANSVALSAQGFLAPVDHPIQLAAGR
jgi:hypothetical protein